MKTKIISFIVIVAMLIVSCKKDKKGYVNVPEITASDACGVGCDTLVFKPNNPSDVKILNQQCANTFAWQSFIALTWPASPTVAGEPDRNRAVAEWGKPGDLTPMTFGTYISAEDVFTDNGTKEWGSDHAKLMNTNAKDGKSVRSIISMHKFNDDEVIKEFFQATGGTPWLTDQKGNLIWYEKKMNHAEYAYIKDNKLYDPIHQKQVAKDKGIWLPNGAIEVKASWREIPKGDYEKLKNRYKIITALVPKSVKIKDGKVVTNGSEEKMLGLVGLHIIQKTPAMPQFHWATFEHEDLAPETNISTSDVDWLLYNPEHYQDKTNVSPNIETDQLDTPIQVLKSPVAAPQQDAVLLNQYVKSQIKKVSPKSVFQHYKLVGSQWPSSAVSDADNNTFTPLKNGGKTPMVLTNVSLETYAQGISCLECHVGAGNKYEKHGKEYASDYSFLFKMAKEQIIKEK